MESLDNLIKGKLLSDKNIWWILAILWNSAILEKVDKKIPKLKNRIKPSKSNPFVKQINIINCLEALQKIFVLVPIDKTPNKVAIICKQYYVEVI